MALGLTGLLAVLLGIIALVIFKDYRNEQAKFVSEADAISRLVIDRAGYPTLVLQNRSDRWFLTEPCELPVTTSRIDPLLGALSNVAGSYDSNEVDLSEVGLADPQLITTIDDDAISIGAIDSSGNRRYAMRGDRVGFVPEWVSSLADGGISALAQLDVFHSPLSQLGDIPTIELPAWQALSASQIILWPVPDAPPSLSDETLDLVYVNGQQDTLNLTRNKRYTALRLGNSQCAYILPNEDIPD